MDLYSGHGLTQVDHNCFVHTDPGTTRPRYLVGVIRRQGTGGRLLPPACFSGFDTAGTPFAKGHIMALELGGCDEPLNIVPQYERWQGNPGAAGDGDTWRDMELALSAGAQEVMVVQIDYAAVPDQYMVNKTAFNAGAQLVHWTGPNIPTRFRIWGVTQATVAAYLAMDKPTKEGNIETLMVARRAELALYDFTIAAMPPIDRRFWKKNMVRDAARLLHMMYTEEVDRARDVALNKLPPGRVSRSSFSSKPPTTGAASKGSPYAKPTVVMPAPPSSFAIWSATQTARTQIIARIRNNDGGASADWDPAERLAFDAGALQTALLG